MRYGYSDQSLGFSYKGLDVIEAFGFLAAAQEQWERAIRLWGAVAALKTDIGLSPELYEQEDYRRDIAAARSSLGESAFNALWQEGQAMTEEQVAAFALVSSPDCKAN